MMLDTTGKKLLNLLQADFPLTQRPFEMLGEKLGISEMKTIEQVQSLKEKNIIYWIGGSSRLGYRSTLVAMHIPDHRLDEAAGLISEHPGVSHNYARTHYYNLWFTLTLPADESLDEVIDALSKRVGSEATVNLPSQKLFKINVYFNMLGEERGPLNTDQQSIKEFNPTQKEENLSSADKKAIRELQKDLPIQEKPFDAMAKYLGMEVEELLNRARLFKANGTMRRYRASLRHRQAGFSANAMSCWNVPPELVERVGRKAAEYKEVSHCYQRQTNPNWSYNIFAMIHGHTPEECEVVARQISRDTGISDYVLLYSTKEYKKERIQYFTD
jgi:DNA-binding Lrp family transcriptional regulator